MLPIRKLVTINLKYDDIEFVGVKLYKPVCMINGGVKYVGMAVQQSTQTSDDSLK